VTAPQPADLAPGVLARLAAAEALDRVVRQRIDLDRAFAPPAALSASDRAFAYSILVTALRRRGQIAAILDALIERPLPTGAGLARSLLETACAQLLFMGVAPHAVIHSAVAACREDRHARHFAALANAVLRRVASEGRGRADALPPAVNTPDWLYARWREAFGENLASDIAAAHVTEPPLDLTIRPGGDASGLAGAPPLWNGTVRLSGHKGPIEEIPGFADGSWWVQDQAAALPATLFTGPPGEALDICAAPGGKTAQLAAAGNRVTALDRSAARLATLEGNLQRLKLPATVVCADFLLWQGGDFDKVLLDAPCSATGTIRRHPDIPWLRSANDIAKLAALQTRLLDHAAGFVRAGGELIYCTCSLEPEEGERQIEGFLTRHPLFTRRPIKPDELGGHGELITPKGDLRTLPVHGMDGFFAARLVR
jgi:16S rRNA (cytosine967-C5)-methyltransferase